MATGSLQPEGVGPAPRRLWPRGEVFGTGRGKDGCGSCEAVCRKPWIDDLAKFNLQMANLALFFVKRKNVTRLLKSQLETPGRKTKAKKMHKERAHLGPSNVGSVALAGNEPNNSLPSALLYGLQEGVMVFQFPLGLE